MHKEIRGFNRRVGCKPPERQSVEASVSGGFATVKQKGSLMALEVVFGCEDISSGNRVHVSGDQIKHPWFITDYQVNGTKFVLVPMDAILLVESDERDDRDY